MSTPKARMMAVRRQIVRTFKKHQLTLQLDATEFIEDTLEAQNVPPEDLVDTLENIATGYVAREGTTAASFAFRNHTLRLDRLRPRSSIKDLIDFPQPQA